MSAAIRGLGASGGLLHTRGTDSLAIKENSQLEPLSRDTATYCAAIQKAPGACQRSSYGNWKGA